MFREGTNKKGLKFFVFAILAILIYLAYQSGGVITETETYSIDPEQNYHAKLIFGNATYEMWRFDNFIKFQQDDQIQFYFDDVSDSLRVYNRGRLVAPNSNFSDFIIKYDPYQVIVELKDTLSYEGQAGRYDVELYGENSAVYLNDQDLPDSILFDNSSTKIQYMYLNIGETVLSEVLPQEPLDED